MSTRLALRIQERFDELSPSERKLAELVLERQDDLLTYSATELATFAGVSKATAARLFRSLGYRDFNDVRLQAREERNRTPPFERRPTPVQPAVGARSLSSHLAMEIANITRSFETLRSDELTRAGELLSSARKVWVLGLGLEEGLARHARLQLSRLRPEVQLIGAQPGAWGEDLALTGSGDALLLISVAPRQTALRPIIEYGRTTRLAIVSLVDVGSAAWARRFSQVVVPCHGATAVEGGSFATIVSAIRLIAASISDRIGRAALQRADLIAEIHEELGDEEA